MKKIDMTGWVMSEHGVPDSELTVIKEVEPHITKGGTKQVQYLCKCSCGKEVIVRGAYLRNGNTKSCGHIAKEKLIQRNIQNGKQIQPGDRFGKLTVIQDLGMRKQKSRNKQWRWSLCQCDCGSNPIEVPNNSLITGNKKSCGCLYSYGEHLIEQILQQNNINYIKEYKFSNLLSEKGNFLRFDFAIFKNDKLDFLIEFDGRQHYTGPEGEWTERYDLNDIQQRDKIKDEYCINNNIVLKRIPYFQISQITIENIMSDKFNIKEKL